MHLYWGAMDAALEASVTQWETYPFKRSPNKISFTQALLVGLGLPDAQGDGMSNLTMHQFMRVLYADQPSLHSLIFRTDTFDSALTRETVGNYLCGIYDDKLYSAQLERRTLEKEAAQLDAELKSIFTVLAKSQKSTAFDFIGAQIQAVELERDLTVNELTRLKTDRVVATSKKRERKPEESLRRELSDAKAGLIATEELIIRKELDIADSQNLVREIELRLRNLEESRAARNYIGSLAFAFCPSCLTPTSPPEQPDTCSLCKSPLTEIAGDTQMIRMRNELRIQHSESLQLIATRSKEVTDLKNQIPTLQENLKRLEKRFDASTKVWSSELEEAIEAAARRIGELEQEIKSLLENQRLVAVVRQLQERRDEIAIQSATLDTQIESLVYSQEERKRQVSLEVAQTLGSLLRQDLHRQEEFKKAENVQFSFTDNVVSVDGAKQFSESSTVVLRHLFHVALLSTACKVASMRLPRFMILDGIEDGGMELPRSHRLQEIIANECMKYPCDFQLIFATSQIAPSLDKPEFVVGRAFSEEQRSLAIL